MSYHKMFSTKETPQAQPIPGSNQVENRAGGYAWAVDEWALLDRFLILGTTEATYYAKPQELTTQAGNAIMQCVRVDGKRVVDRIVEISHSGRAAKNNPALFALAIAASAESAEVRRYALYHLPRVARIGTHLFAFLNYVRAFRGHGRALNRALREWYTAKSLDNLAYQTLKYRSRDGWSHRDVLRLARPVPKGEEQRALFRYITQGELGEAIMNHRLVSGFVALQTAETAKDAAKLIADLRLPREFVPTQLLTEAIVWEALLVDMPLTALIRNLGNMSKVGLIAQGKHDVISKVVGDLTNPDKIRGARVHPIAVLAALTTYRKGSGFRGSGQWGVVPQIVDALDEAFYLSFGNVESTGKRWLLALDVSGSMTWPDTSCIPGLTARDASAAMAMVTARSEKSYGVVGFSHELIELTISPRQRLDDVITTVDGLPFGRTDCALPMVYARENKIPIDMFVIYTDNETWFGNIHPMQALQAYRRKMNIPAKLAVVAMTADKFSIADPNDGGAMDFVGFDTATPQALAEFSKLG